MHIRPFTYKIQFTPTKDKRAEFMTLCPQMATSYLINKYIATTIIEAKISELWICNFLRTLVTTHIPIVPKIKDRRSSSLLFILFSFNYILWAEPLSFSDTHEESMNSSILMSPLSMNEQTVKLHQILM